MTAHSWHEPPHTFHIPTDHIQRYREAFANEPSAAVRGTAYVVLTRQHFENAFPDLNPAQHVCRIYHDQELNETGHLDVDIVFHHMDLILDEYNEYTQSDPPWTARLQLADVDFDTARRLLDLLHTMTDPGGNWAPDYREMTPVEMLESAGLSPEEIWQRARPAPDDTP